MITQESVEEHQRFLKELHSYIKDCLDSGLSPIEVRKSLDYLAKETMVNLFLAKAENS